MIISKLAKMTYAQMVAQRRDNKNKFSVAGKYPYPVLFEKTGIFVVGMNELSMALPAAVAPHADIS